jgi:uncharacterized protein
VQQLENAANLIQPIVDRIHCEVSNTLGSDWLEHWHQGIPEWEELPGLINVKDIVRLWTWAKSIDLVEFATWRYNMLSADDIWVQGNPVQDFDAKAMREKLSANRFGERILDILYEARNLFGGEKIKKLSES